jgi:MYXO-CTERM domain-containing protein
MQEQGFSFVLTRLHARYGKDGAPNDLVFKAAPPIVGGREFLVDGKQLEERSRPDAMNNFQGRYAIRHRWTGAVRCESPKFGRWGGPPAGAEIAEGGTVPATNTAFAPRGQVQLPNLVAQDIPEIGVKAGQPLSGGGGVRSNRGCGCSSTDVGSLASAGAIGALALVWRRRRRRR